MKKISKTQLRNFALVVIGTFVTAFGSTVFLVPLNILSGGLTSIGIIINHFVQIDVPFLENGIVDIVIFICTWLLWLLGLIVLGKDFSIKTLVSSIVFPLATLLFYRVPFFSEITAPLVNNGSPETGSILLAGLIGSIFVGGGLSITFLGGGSTGGVDIFAFIVEKYFKVKQSITIFLVDGAIIVIGLITMWSVDDIIVSCLVGMLSALLGAVVLDIIYVGYHNSYVVDIISAKWEEINIFVQDELGRGSTIFTVEGGYKYEVRKLLRVVLDRKEYRKLRDEIVRIDPRAFVTFTAIKLVHGEGFVEFAKEQNDEKK